MLATLETELKRWIAQTSLTVQDAQVHQLARYIMLLDKWNKAYNLTAIRDPKEMVIKHIMDSLVVSPYLQGDRFIDVGTGPGLPGVPLAILNPDKQFYLVDSLGKRIRFLKQVKFELELTNIHPQQARVESLTDLQCDGVISRAFASLSDMLSLCHHLPHDKGYFYALKGEIPTEEIEALDTKYRLKECVSLHVPGLDAQRHLLLIQRQE